MPPFLNAESKTAGLVLSALAPLVLERADRGDISATIAKLENGVPEHGRTITLADGTTTTLNLPTVVSNSSVPDLRLLSGDRGDPDAVSPAVKSVLDTAKDGNMVALVTVSGAGKSKCMIDVLRCRYGVLLDMNGGLFGKVDAGVQSMLGEMRALPQALRDPRRLEDACQEEFAFLLSARLATMLVLMFDGRLKSPLHWLLLQLDGMVIGEELTGSLVRQLRSLARVNNFKGSEVCAVLCRLVREFMTIKDDPIIAIDEAGVLLNELPDQFYDKDVEWHLLFFSYRLLSLGFF